VTTRADVEKTLQSFSEMISYVISSLPIVTPGKDDRLTSKPRKYQFMEQSTQKRALGLKDKIPDIQKTLETVQFLKSRDVRLSLVDFARAKTNQSPIRRTTTNRLRHLSNSTTLSSPRQTSRRSTRSTFG
jgi:hypothetical protein